MKFIRYRIVTDTYLGYEAQAWRLWWPFWTDFGLKGQISNTHISIEKAREFIKNGTVVWEEKNE